MDFFSKIFTPPPYMEYPLSFLKYRGLILGHTNVWYKRFSILLAYTGDLINHWIFNDMSRLYGIRMYIIIFIKKIPQKAIFLTVSLPTSCTWNFLKGIILSLLEFISSGQDLTQRVSKQPRYTQTYTNNTDVASNQRIKTLSEWSFNLY